jgi:hypothetical protein
MGTFLANSINNIYIVFGTGKKKEMKTNYTLSLTKIKHDKKNYHFHYFSDRLSARES